MRFLLLALAVLPAVAGAQTVRDSVITVSVVRQARLDPDRASFFAVVEGTAETAPDAVARVTAKAKPILDALRAVPGGTDIGLPNTFAVAPTVNRNGYPGAINTSSFTARAVIRVTSARPPVAATLMAAALSAGATNVSFVIYEFSAADSVRRLRSAEALTAAQLEAAAIATALGGRLGSLIDVTASPTASQAQRNLLGVDFSYGQELLTPEVVVVANVTARYRLTR